MKGQKRARIKNAEKVIVTTLLLAKFTIFSVLGKLKILVSDNLYFVVNGQCPLPLTFICH